MIVAVPNGYSFSLQVRCDTKIFHVNINLAGVICLNLLKEKWTPILTAVSLLKAIQQLLAEPNHGTFNKQ